MPLYENFGPDSIGTSAISPSERFRHQLTIASRVHVWSLGYIQAYRSHVLTKYPNSANHSDLSVIFAQPQNVSTLLSLSPKLSALKTIVALGDISEAARKIADAWGKERRIRILTLHERERVPGNLHFASLMGTDLVETTGAQAFLPPPPITADTIATICYTSVSDLRQPHSPKLTKHF